MGITGAPIADQLCKNGSSACFGEIEVLQEENGGTLTHHKAIAGGIERTTRPLRIIITAREGVHVIERCHSNGSNGFLRPASDHRLCITPPNSFPRLADGVSAGGTGRNGSPVR